MSRQLHRCLTVPALIAAAWFCSTALTGAAEATAEKPNFVILFADDLGYGDLGCYGHPKYKTPNLDRMAKEGVRLTNFYVPVPYCAPSRGTILTGRYPFRHGVVQNPCPDAGVNDVGIPESEITLAEALKKAGYATYCIGKWHLGHKPEFYPTRHGFDHYYGILYSNDMRPVELFEDEKVVEYPVVQCTLTRRYTERALEFIEKSKDRPFFLYLPHAMPHKPLAPSEDFYKKTGTGLYGDVIAELDWSVGQVLAKLKELGLDEKTLVIFASDNGPWFGGSTGGLRGMKGNTWEGGLRVPMIARWPGKIPAGRTVNKPAGTIDVLPTLLTAAGAPVPDDRVIDGRDIMPMIARGADSPHEALFAMGGPNLKTICSGRWKLHVLVAGKWPSMSDDWVDPRGPDGVTILAPYEQSRPSEYPGLRTGDPQQKMMLFDLESDPAEQHNVAAEHPEVVKRLAGLFERMLAQFPEKLKPPRRKPKGPKR